MKGLEANRSLWAAEEDEDEEEEEETEEEDTSQEGSERSGKNSKTRERRQKKSKKKKKAAQAEEASKAEAAERKAEAEAFEARERAVAEATARICDRGSHVRGLWTFSGATWAHVVGGWAADRGHRGGNGRDRIEEFTV